MIKIENFQYESVLEVSEMQVGNYKSPYIQN